MDMAPIASQLQASLLCAPALQEALPLSPIPQAMRHHLRPHPASVYHPVDVPTLLTVPHTMHLRMHYLPQHLQDLLLHHLLPHLLSILGQIHDEIPTGPMVHLLPHLPPQNRDMRDPTRAIVQAVICRTQYPPAYPLRRLPEPLSHQWGTLADTANLALVVEPHTMIPVR